MRSKLALVIIFCVFGFAGALLFARQQIQSRPAPAFHEHADIALFIDGVRFDFSKPEFMSNVPCKISSVPKFVLTAQAHGVDETEAVHLHDGDGEVIHLHQPGVTVHGFFESLNMSFEDGSFTDHEGRMYQEDGTRSFRYAVNGKEISTLQDYVFRDLDRVLISYAKRDRDETAAFSELGQLSGRSCVFSGSCPGQGLAPIESCGATASKESFVLRWLGL